jgi:hypothetical protein
MTVYDRRDGDREEERHAGKSQSRTPVEMGKPGKAGSRPKVLARLPNLDIDELDRIIDADPPLGARRPLGQKISAAILVGVGSLFLLVAIKPYLSKSERGFQPPAPSAPAAPAWDATAATNTPSTKQAQSTPAVPVSIPALPSSIPSVPDSIQGPANAPASPTGMPVPSWNKHSTAPAPVGPAPAVSSTATSPGLAEVSQGPVAAAPPIAAASPPAVSPPAEPGVARLQGVIESTQRPNYDPSRSSLR